jgi:signal transduction histidine kinase
MKLLNKNSLTIISVALFVSLIAGVVFYHWMKQAWTKDIDKRLKQQSEIVIKALADGMNQEELSKVLWGNVELNKEPVAKPKSKAVYDSVIVNRTSKTVYTCRVYKSYFLLSGVLWECVLYSDAVDSNSLIESLLFLFLGLFVFFSIMILLVNLFMQRKIDSFVLQIENMLSRFNVGKGIVTGLGAKCEIEELRRINDKYYRVMEKAGKAYSLQKEFAEDVAHELISPVALCINKFEVLLQDDDLKEKQIRGLYSMYRSIKRMSGIVQSLNQLTILGGNVYEGCIRINLKQKMISYFEKFADSFQEKDIELEYIMEDSLIVMNEGMCDVMIGNLLQNAVRYTDVHGKVIVTLNNDFLVVRNTSVGSRLRSKMDFQRYQRSMHKESLGIGLSLVRKICDQYEFELSYRRISNLNVFKINFSNNVLSKGFSKN